MDNTQSGALSRADTQSSYIYYLSSSSFKAWTGGCLVHLRGSEAGGGGAAFAPGGPESGCVSRTRLARMAKQSDPPDHTGDGGRAWARRNGVRSAFCEPSICARFLLWAPRTRSLPASLTPRILVSGVLTSHVCKSVL